METTQPTNTTPDPTTSHRTGSSGTTVALAGVSIAAGITTTLVATPVLALVMFNHNETLVRSPDWS